MDAKIGKLELFLQLSEITAGRGKMDYILTHKVIMLAGVGF